MRYHSNRSFSWNNASPSARERRFCFQIDMKCFWDTFILKIYISYIIKNTLFSRWGARNQCSRANMRYHSNRSFPGGTTRVLQLSQPGKILQPKPRLGHPENNVFTLSENTLTESKHRKSTFIFHFEKNFSTANVRNRRIAQATLMITVNSGITFTVIAYSYRLDQPENKLFLL